MSPGQSHRVEVEGALEGQTVADAVRFVSSGVSAPGIHYVHADHLGSPQKMTDSTKAIVWDAVYTPFGQVHSITGTATNSQRFPGQYADAETGYSYNYFRDYDPTIGRYIESDPIGLNGGLNTYAYVGGNPLIRSDEEGTIWQPPVLFCARFPNLCRGAFQCLKNPVKCFKQARRGTCRAIHASYKAICDKRGGCNGKTCKELTNQAKDARNCYLGRKLYLGIGCDKVIQTKRDLRGELANRKRAWKNCKDKRDEACACEKS